MVEPAELRPEELDRLEDALELLEVADIDDPSPAVRERLGDFRRILQLSRSALPAVDVPHGVLERVFAEARQAVEVPVITPVAEPPRREEPSFWAKLRRFALLPGIALAGAAALVLFMVNSPERAATSGADQVARAEPDASLVSERQDRARAEQAPTGSSTRAGGDAAAAAEPVPLAEPAPPPAAATPTPAPATVTTPAQDPALEKSKPKGVVDDAEDMPAEEEPLADAKTADTTMPRWDIIARGDRARQKGDCDAARTEYKLALGDADARVRARAHAGIGLCAAADGEQGAADSAYKAARELDPEIVEFIDTERPRGGGAGSSNAARASKQKKSKAKPAPVQTDDALDPAE
jgi:hypothetical protein